jgi:LysR family transcriptional regulator, hydrogen peroxide-inducible genes activator
MELNQVRYFITLCRTLNFTRAAEQCNVTQPAFTRSIQRLEDELGGALLFRERNLTQLTELGRAMRTHLETMLDAADAAQALANAKLKNWPWSRHRRGQCRRGGKGNCQHASGCHDPFQ